MGGSASIDENRVRVRLTGLGECQHFVRQRFFKLSTDPVILRLLRRRRVQILLLLLLCTVSCVVGPLLLTFLGPAERFGVTVFLAVCASSRLLDVSEAALVPPFALAFGVVATSFLRLLVVVVPVKAVEAAVWLGLLAANDARVGGNEFAQHEDVLVPSERRRSGQGQSGSNGVVVRRQPF